VTVCPPVGAKRFSGHFVAAPGDKNADTHRNLFNARAEIRFAVCKFVDETRESVAQDDA
jgi:hypothetical protein